MAADHLGHLPILKAKKGEFDAVSLLDQAQRDRLTPLFEIGPLEVDPKTEVTVESVDQALDGVAAKIANSWGSLDFCFVDLPNFDASIRMEDGRHPAARFFDDAKAVDLAARPVTGPDRSSAQLEAVMDIVSASPFGGNGVAIRLRRGELRNPDSLPHELSHLIGRLSADPRDVDLLLDFGPILKSEEAAIRSEAETALRGLPDLDTWRTITLCAGAFPQTVSTEVEPGATGIIARREWNLWKTLLDSGRLPRAPKFGDYGVSAPEWLRGFDPEIMSPAAKIVYAREEDWLVLRGRSVKKGHDQFRSLADRVLKSGSFRGGEHCSGDEFIEKCAKGGVGTGNLATWVTVATTHHLCVVADQLASLA